MQKVEVYGSTSTSDASLEVTDSLFVLSPKHMRLSPSELPINLCIFAFEISLYYTAQAGLEPLTLLPLPSKYWNGKHEPPHPG